MALDDREYMKDRAKKTFEREYLGKRNPLERFRLPDSVKEERLQRIRAKLEAATPGAKRKKEFRPGLALIFWAAVLAVAVWWFKNHPS